MNFGRFLRQVTAQSHVDGLKAELRFGGEGGGGYVCLTQKGGAYCEEESNLFFFQLHLCNIPYFVSVFRDLRTDGPVLR